MVGKLLPVVTVTAEGRRICDPRPGVDLTPFRIRFGTQWLINEGKVDRVICTARRNGSTCNVTGEECIQPRYERNDGLPPRG